MKIRFLRDCHALQSHTETCGDGCCAWEKWTEQWFLRGEEVDPEDWTSGKVDLKNLKYNEDYEILEYP